jgi:ribosomal-protein-alanine N-acetyltransferase
MLITALIQDDCSKAALLHQQAFYKGWTEKDFKDFIDDPLIYGLKITKNDVLTSIILWQEVGNEAEILTLIVDPTYQNQGLAGLLLKTLMTHLVRKNISQIFLEVAEDNEVAHYFYKKNGFHLLNKRPQYYKREGNNCVTALNLMKKLF